MSSCRVGFGFDVHKFANKSGKLILGGVCVSESFCLDAVSDGDVLLHAVADAICGAAGLGDIGDYFPPELEKSKGISSKEILNFILKKVKRKFTISNLDLTIIAEKPKLVLHKPAILRSLISLLACKNINVKIKSKEGLNILGGTEAIACMATVLLC